ncbi:putative Phosphoglucomutase [Quillaja saponaria]|uniref:phosphoglucomutase (alpha-D-glucose-1,6-bisphosphate-dependent) n=1 Tax=Quillaja saponaria TaxID=32244 RepID=A0AAD7KN40_QUISA|nr:putative Phosphoglucomutase [Quillaja saponaria]
MEKLELYEFPELKEIWHGPFPNRSFFKLRELIVERCDFVSNVISVELLRLLNNLEELKVRSCDLVEAIFDLEGTDDIEEYHGHNRAAIHSRKLTTVAKGLEELEELDELDIDSCSQMEVVSKEEEIPGNTIAINFVFPKATSVSLKNLPNLKYFYPGPHTVEWPQLERIYTLFRGKLEIFTIDFISFQETDPEDDEPVAIIQQTMFSIEKVLPNIEHLSLDGKDAMRIWNGQYVVDDLFRNLTFLRLQSFHDEQAASNFPYWFIQKITNLDGLVVKYSSFQEIFPCERHVDEETQTMTASHLSKLTLWALTKLEKICKDGFQPDPILEILETLEVWECSALLDLVPSRVSFNHLKNLDVWKCNGMLHLLTCTTAKSLVQLSEMRIRECEIIEEIVFDKEDQGEVEIVLESLEILELQCLPSLVNFCGSMNFAFNFPSLKKVIVRMPQGAGATLVVSGDGRYFSKEAIQIITKMAAANGVRRVRIGQNGLLSTPAVSAVIRERVGADGSKAAGTFILTASHNPGGPHEDFGIKYNMENGGPAPEVITDKIYENTKTINEYLIAEDLPDVDITIAGVTNFSGPEGQFDVEVFDSATDYVKLMKSIFDFESIRKLLTSPNFTFCYGSLHGVAGAYAKRIFVEELGAQESSLLNCTPKEDFGGGHPDPNLTYAKELVARMGLGKSGSKEEPPEFGAAADGDADRNMVLGKRFFVTPSDSVAIIAANVPTGRKFFGNLMDAGLCSICGEESFGTGSDHIQNLGGRKLVTVEDIVHQHWATYGRHYYTRYDYENMDAGAAKELMAYLVKLQSSLSEVNEIVKGIRSDVSNVVSADEFEYKDPVDGSISKHQGIRYVFKDGSRLVFRLSGTGSEGATISLYIEQYEKDSSKTRRDSQEALAPLVEVALKLSKMQEYTGRSAPTVIT